MSDVLVRINQAMSVVVSRIDAPLVTGVWMGCVPDTVSDGITHAWIIMLHVHFHTHGALTFCESTLTHLLKVTQVLFDSGISPWRINLFLAATRHLFCILETNISFFTANELNSMIIKLLEVVRRCSGLERCVAQPAYNLFNVVNELVVFLAWVCVIKS